MIAWTLQALHEVEVVVEVIPVMRDEDLELGVEITERYGLAKVKKVVPGGRERQHSVYNGLRFIDGKDCIVLIHDGVRPLVKPDLIRRAISALEDHDGVVAAVPLTDTVKEVYEGMVKKTLSRDLLIATQTPQVFPYRVLMDAYTTVMEEGLRFTDDSAVVEHCGGRVKAIMGDHTNIKITTREDILIAEAYLKGRP